MGQPLKCPCANPNRQDSTGDMDGGLLPPTRNRPCPQRTVRQYPAKGCTSIPSPESFYTSYKHSSSSPTLVLRGRSRRRVATAVGTIMLYTRPAAYPWPTHISSLLALCVIFPAAVPPAACSPAPIGNTRVQCANPYIPYPSYPKPLTVTALHPVRSQLLQQRRQPQHFPISTQG